MKIDIIIENKLIIPEYIIDVKNKSKKTIELIEQFERLKNIDKEKNEKKEIEKSNIKNYKKKKFKKKYFKKSK